MQQCDPTPMYNGHRNDNYCFRCTKLSVSSLFMLSYLIHSKEPSPLSLQGTQQITMLWVNAFRRLSSGIKRPEFPQKTVSCLDRKIYSSTSSNKLSKNGNAYSLQVSFVCLTNSRGQRGTAGCGHSKPLVTYLLSAVRPY